MILTNANPKYSFRVISQSDIISMAENGWNADALCDGIAKIIMPFQGSITQKKYPSLGST